MKKSKIHSLNIWSYKIDKIEEQPCSARPDRFYRSLNTCHGDGVYDKTLKNRTRTTRLCKNKICKKPIDLNFPKNFSNKNNELDTADESVNINHVNILSLTKFKKHSLTKNVPKKRKSEFWKKKRKQIDWKKASQRKDLSITFSPGPKQRARMIETLKRSETDKERKDLVSRLSEKFLSTYSKYRKTKKISYTTMPRERKHAESAAILCIYKEVTPVELIEYWDEHVGDFTRLKIPPLSFLASPANVDRVACEKELLDRADRPVLASTKGAKHHSIVHDFSDVDRLDERLRPGLTKAGFDLCGFSDRYLLTLQSASKAIAEGFDMFVSDKMKPMVMWAAKNLYSQEK